MDRKKKKKLAAILGVIDYISKENQVKPKKYVPNYQHPWTAQGNQITMNNNYMLQRRLVRR